MKNYYLLLIALCSFFFSHSQLLLNEDFNYESSSGVLTIDSDGVWQTAFAGSPTVAYSDIGLTMPDYAAYGSTGSVTIANSNGERVNRSFADVNPGKLFYSALVNFNSAGIGDSGFFLHLSNGADFRARVFVRDDMAGGINFGIISQGSNATIVWTSQSYNLNTTYLIVASYSDVSGTSDLYVLTAPTLAEPAPVASQTAAAVTGFNAVAIRQHANGPVGTIDGIRVSTEWEYLMIDIALTDGPQSGSSIVTSPETVNTATIDFATTSFDMSDDSGDGMTGNPSTGAGFIKWDVKDDSDNSIVDEGSIFTSNSPSTTYPVNNLVQGKTYHLTARLVNNDGDLFSPDLDFIYELTFTIASYTNVSNLADLRNGTLSEEVFYRVTGSVTHTYSRTLIDQQYFQDDMGGIMVFDVDDAIATYSPGDVVSDIKGHLIDLNGNLVLIPTDASWGAASMNSPVIPEKATTTQIRNALESYESKLVEIENATFLFPGGDFTAGQVHLINDGGAMNFAFRCSFPEANYIGTPIPSTPQDIIGIIREFNSAPRIVARSLADITLEAENFAGEEFKIYPNPTSLGYINIFSGGKSELEVSIFDLLGKQVMVGNVINDKLNVASLKSGMYLLRISQEYGYVTQKLIIE